MAGQNYSNIPDLSEIMLPPHNNLLDFGHGSCGLDRCTSILDVILHTAMRTQDPAHLITAGLGS